MLSYGCRDCIHGIILEQRQFLLFADIVRQVEITSAKRSAALKGKRAPQARQDLWDKIEVYPRGIDREKVDMKIVIIGAESAGVSAVQTIWTYERDAKIVMFSAEPHLRAVAQLNRLNQARGCVAFNFIFGLMGNPHLQTE